MEKDLLDFGAKEVRRAATTFSARTGWRVGNLGPRQFMWLSDELLECVASLLKKIEKAGIWPQQIQEALIHLIPKPTGGRRPVGLVASLPRIWDRIRRRELEKWRGTYSREYNWMTKGRGSERAVWAQSIEEEAALFDGKKSSAVLIDLVKAFEKVTLDTVWRGGIEAKFPAAMLRLAMELCTVKRRLVYRKAASKEVVETETAILAGLGVATDLMFIKLVRPLDTLQREFLDMRMYVVADDVRLGFHHHDEDKLARITGEATDRAVQLLEDEEHMEVSRGQGGKTIALTSNAKLSKYVGGKVRRKGIVMKKEARNLGVAFTLRKGGKRRVIQKKRWLTVKERWPRAKRVGGRAGGRVAATGFAPSVTYGVNVTGMTDGLLASLRALIGQARGSCRGRSTSARLAMEGVDPGVKVVVGPLMQWVDAWWDKLVQEGTMRKAWRYAVVNVGMAARPNAKVRGGAGAMMAALRRVGWSAPAPDAMRTREGIVLYFGNGHGGEGTQRTDPRSARRWMLDAYECELMRHSEVAKDINCLGGGQGH